jgi:hypothetical protein
MQWLVLSWALTCGFVPANQQNVYEAVYMPALQAYQQTTLGQINNTGSLTTEVALSAEGWGHVRLSGSIETLQHEFSVYKANYIMGVAYFTKHLEFGMNYMTSSAFPAVTPGVPWLEDSETRFYFRLSGKMGN